ncbi:MAG: ATP-binding protein, partial [Bdellovibrionota bacterium]|nr:ATP-binding protein [Bdellovibrionota bacterium]
KRKEQNKDEFGLIEINCFEDGDNKFNIEIKDDGKGLNKEHIVKKALNKNLVTEGDISKMNDKEKLGIIFFPNFSTKENVTEISGRGVGMDVVKKNVEQIGGQVHLESEEGKGVTFRIKLNKAST